ncbi:MAG: DUF4230 domain-containing protein [Chloroflexi bacterium]|nr:DUF4230 domain-containing protein [Chloroflexota bacterium]
MSAGVDPQELGETDVVVDREKGTARITLPPARTHAVRLDSGIPQRARSNAEHTVAALVRSLGYTSVIVPSRTEGQ